MMTKLVKVSDNHLFGEFIASQTTLLPDIGQKESDPFGVIESRCQGDPGQHAGRRRSSTPDSLHNILQLVEESAFFGNVFSTALLTSKTSRCIRLLTTDRSHRSPFVWPWRLQMRAMLMCPGPSLHARQRLLQ